MSGNQDDLEAVRVLVETLESFAEADRARIIRWASEKLGTPPPPVGVQTQQTTALPTAPAQPPLTGTDIKTFVESKQPKNDTQFTATVAYFYQFEAPESERTDVITSEVVQEACRKAGRARLTSPKDTLNNTLKAGYLDKGSERGQFKINSVGENLVAMVLPDGSASATPRRTSRKSAKKKAAKKKGAKKKASKKKAAKKAKSRRRK